MTSIEVMEKGGSSSSPKLQLIHGRQWWLQGMQDNAGKNSQGMGVLKCQEFAEVKSGFLPVSAGNLLLSH